jgi:hypothetical protein
VRGGFGFSADTLGAGEPDAGQPFEDEGAHMVWAHHRGVLRPLLFRGCLFAILKRLDLVIKIGGLRHEASGRRVREHRIKRTGVPSHPRAGECESHGMLS